MEQRNFVSFDWPIDESDEQRENYDVVPPGRAILERIRNALASRGFDVAPVCQHKFYGWCFDSKFNGVTVWTMLQHPGPWFLISEPRQSLLKRLFGRDQTEPLATVCSAIGAFLSNSPDATSIQWFSRSEFRTQEGATGAESS